MAKLIKWSKLRRYQLLKLIECFCLDIEASKTAVLLRLNRNTVNRHYSLFRRMIFTHQLTQLRLFVGVVEADESYFGSALALQRALRGKVDPASVVLTDAWRGYDGLVDVGYDKHIRINKAQGFAKGRAHINCIEAFWSFTKRRLAKFNGVKKLFALHLKECEWRYNQSLPTLKASLFSLIKSYPLPKIS